MKFNQIIVILNIVPLICTGEVSFKVTAGTVNRGLHFVPMTMKTSQTIRDIKEKLSQDEMISIDKLSVWCIDYATGEDEFVIDEEKTLGHYTQNEKTISKIYIKESGFQPVVKQLGISALIL